MKSLWFERLKEENEGEIEWTSEMGKPVWKSNKQYTADLEAKYKKERELAESKKTQEGKENVFS
jgi:hypothetical protein